VRARHWLVPQHPKGQKRRRPAHLKAFAAPAVGIFLVTPWRDEHALALRQKSIKCLSGNAQAFRRIRLVVARLKDGSECL